MVSHLPLGGWGIKASTASLKALVDSVPFDENSSGLLAILHQRLEHKPEDWPVFESIALKLAVKIELIKSGGMDSHYWEGISAHLTKGHPRKLAAAIFGAQSARDDGAWFIEHASANGILRACFNGDPDGVWDELAPWLENEKRVGGFLVGFPAGIISLVPVERILNWIGKDSKKRVSIAASMVTLDLSEGSLAATLLEKYPQDAAVAQELFRATIEGAWSGHASDRWTSIANRVGEIAKDAKNAAVRRWAIGAAEDLRLMATRDRKREEEEALRRR